MENGVGEIRVLEKLNKYEFAVSIRIMREGLNRNQWDYQNLEKYYLSFKGQPILCAFPDGRIGDGHTMEEKVDKNGEFYYSFIGADSEKIVGTISENAEDLSLVQEDGETWLVAKGRLFAFYAKELVDYIVEKGVMEVSAETEVYESHEEPGKEVFTEWRGLAVTILGSGVAPAIPGARIEKLAAIRDEFNTVLLKAASYIANEDDPDDDEEDEEEEKSDPEDDVDDEPNNEPQQNSTERNEKALEIFRKKQLAELAPRFEGYTVLSAGQDDDGIHVCLMSNAGETAVYTMAALEDLIDPKKIVNVGAQVTFAVNGWTQSVDLDAVTDDLTAKVVSANNELDSTKTALATAEQTITSMTDKEMKRRVSAAKAKALSTLEAFNANREQKVDAKVLTKINECIDNGDFSECENAEGEWVGEEEVCNQVLAACAKEVMEMDKANSAMKNSQFIWDGISKSNKAADGGVASLLESFDIH